MSNYSGYQALLHSTLLGGMSDTVEELWDRELNTTGEVTQFMPKKAKS